MATYKVFFTDAGVPATGLAPTIPVLKRVDTQDDITPPLVYEIGGGWYTFEHEPEQAQVGYVDGTATLDAADRYIPIDLNVEDVYLDAPVAVIDENVDSILEDTGTTLPAAIADVPTVAEFEARSLPAADYTVVSDLPVAPDNAGIAAIQAQTDLLPASPADVSDIPTAAEITDAVLDELLAGHTDVGTVGFALGGATLRGTGSISVVIDVAVGGEPEDGVDVWVTSDEAGLTVVAGTLQTDINGQAVFYLDAGDYFLWKQKEGVNFTNPQSITVDPEV